MRNLPVTKVWDMAIEAVAKLRADGVVSADAHVFLESKGDGPWMIRSIHRRSICKSFEKACDRLESGFMAHVLPDGRVCCFVGH